MNGLGIQSSSHRYGLFPETLAAIEVVLPTGQHVVLHAEAEDSLHRRLFENLPGTYGTLAIVTAASVRIVPAKDLLDVRYYPTCSPAGHAATLAAAVGRFDYVDGFVYGPTEGVVVAANFVAAAPPGLSRYEGFNGGDEYWYQHARRLAGTASKATGDVKSSAPPSLSTRCSAAGTVVGSEAFAEALLAGKCGREVVSTLQYLFRLERGMWWLAECYVGVPGVADTSLGRWFMDASVAKELQDNDKVCGGSVLPVVQSSERVPG